MRTVCWTHEQAQVVVVVVPGSDRKAKGTSETDGCGQCKQLNLPIVIDRQSSYSRESKQESLRSPEDGASQYSADSALPTSKGIQSQSPVTRRKAYRSRFTKPVAPKPESRKQRSSRALVPSRLANNHSMLWLLACTDDLHTGRC